MKRFKVLSIMLFTLATVSGSVGLGEAGAAQSAAHRVGTHSSTNTVTVQITSTVARPGSVVIQDNAGTVLATCTGPRSKGTTSCVVHLPSNKTAVFVARPAKKAGFKSWAGACGSVPGPVCALLISSKTRVLIRFNRSSTKTSAVPTLNAVEGDTPGCSGYLDAQTVNSAGFAANAHVTLKDDARPDRLSISTSRRFAERELASHASLTTHSP
jgi:hypothetical protein